MTIEQTRKTLLDILIAFDEFCREHDIRYYLAYGTLLGAVRHKGFIPWDDDLDVIVLRDQYEKLKALTAQDRYLDAQRHYRVRVPGDENYAYSYIKIDDTRYTVRETSVADRFNGGLFMDVFCLDYCPATRLRAIRQISRTRLLTRLTQLGIRGNLKKKSQQIEDVLLRPIDRLLPCLGLRPETLLRKIEAVGSDNPPSDEVALLTESGTKLRDRFPLELFDSQIELPFEGRLFPAMVGADRFLRIQYGDYMTLPPEDQRAGHQYDILREPEDSRP